MTAAPVPPQLDPLLVDVDGHRALLLGNEAIARGALEAGLAFFAGYPGTPSSEISDSLAAVAERRGLAFSYSVNEKVALEAAFAASLAGGRAMCAMKHVGLSYAGDPLATIPYIGPGAGLVIVSAGDPSCRTSSNEQDQRWLGPLHHLPTLDPGTPAEALAMTRAAFELSERCRLPVLLRPTTRVCHTRAVVRLGRLAPARTTGFVRDPRRLLPVPENARALRLEIEGRLAAARAWVAGSGFVRRGGGHGRLGVLAGGAPAATCAELLRERGLEGEVALVTVGVTYPLADELLVDLVGDLERVLVVEELSPYLEDSLAALCHRRRLGIEVLGKRSGHLPVPFELSSEVIEAALVRAVEPERAAAGPAEPAVAPRDPTIPPRPPSLCPGCGHRAACFAARAAFGSERLFFNDIGCYTLGAGEPLDSGDALLSMGASIPMAAAVSRLTGERTVAFIGDSTFFHSGMPGLLDAAKGDASIVVVILDNQVTAMTGFQESPLVRLGERGPARDISVVEVARALGVRHVAEADPWDLPAAIAVLERARDAHGPAVVVLRRSCPTHLRSLGSGPPALPFSVDPARCRTCGRAAHGFRCEVPLTRGFERHVTRTRAVEQARPEPRPEVAPCSAACPLFLCVQGYAGHIAAGEHARALEHILARVPLPETVCRLCHRPCESACARRGVDEAVAINDLKRFAVDWARTEGAPYRPARDPDSGRRVAVIGAGPSGLAAAHDLRLRGHEVTIFDARDEPGGLLRSGIPRYRMPLDALHRDVDRVLSLGVRFVGGKALGRDLRLGSLLADGWDAIYLAVGAGRALTLALPGADEPGAPAVATALGYLEDTAFERPTATGRRVVVVGGGNAAIDAARTARRAGAAAVTVTCIESRAEMPALPDEIAAAEEEGIAVRAGLRPVRLQGGAAPGLLLSGDQGEVLVEADRVLLAIGQAPSLALAPGDPELDRLPDGSLRVDPETAVTSHPAIFAGGDVVSGERKVTSAIAAGQRAAWGIDRALRGAEQADRRPPPPRRGAIPIQPWTKVERTDGAARRLPPVLAPFERVRDFAEVQGPLSEVDARAEAERCMSCGLCGNCRSCIDVFGCPAFQVVDEAIRIGATTCIGCGVCVELCPDGAIVPAPAVGEEVRRC